MVCGVCGGHPRNYASGHRFGPPERLGQTAGRAWFPSFAHDNVMFIPMLVAVVARVYEDPRFEGVTLAALLGSSLWIPGRWMNSSSGIELFQWAVWLYAVSFLCRECSARSRCTSDRSFVRP